MRKIFRFLVVAGMLMVLFATGISAAEVGCPGHEGGLGIAASQELSQDNQVYYLTQDITGRTPRSSYYDAFNVTGQNVTLCLNGFNITPSQAAVAVRVADNVKGFKLCNCQSGGGLITGKGNNRSLLLMGNTTVSMYENVHIDNATETTSMVVVQVNNGASFTMHGGTIRNNNFKSSGSSVGNNEVAALVGLTNSTISLKGGEISNNIITGTTVEGYAAAVISSDGTLEIGEEFSIRDNTIHAKGNGAGGVLAHSGAKVTMNGGTIADNTCNKSGGVLIAEEDTVFTMNGGAITGNEGDQFGGGLCLQSGNVTMSAGEISGNRLTNPKPYGTQVSVGGKIAGTAIFTMTGGTITAQEEVSSNDFTVCQGTANIQGGTITGKVDTVGMINPTALNVFGGTIIGRIANGELKRPSGAPITPTIAIAGGKVSQDTKLEELLDWLRGSVSEITENGTTFYQVSGAVCSGHSSYVSNSSSSSRSITTGNKTYYLTGNITSSSTVSGVVCAINVAADNVTLCLNGKSILPSSTSAVAIRCSGKNLKIVNCSTSNGVITGKSTCSVLVVDGGSVTIGENVHIDGAAKITTAPVVLESGGSFTMAGGTIKNNIFSSTVSGYVAGAVAAPNGGTIELQGGTISGNKVTQAVATVGGYSAGAVAMNGGTLNIRDNIVIQSNSAITSSSSNITAGAVCADGGAVITMTGGIVTENTAQGNKACGGGVALYGANTAFTMSDGTLSKNKAGTGGGVEIADSDARFTMTGGILSGNTAGRWGGGVSIRKGVFDLSGGTIKDNDLSNSTYQYGNQVSVGLQTLECKGTFNMTGGTIMDTEAETTAGLQTSTDVTVSQGTATISGGSITGQVGTLGIFDQANLNICGGTIVGDIINAVPLPTSTTYPDQESAEKAEMRSTCTIKITDGKILGQVIQPDRDPAWPAATTEVSGGKFSAHTAQDVLVEFLPWDQEGILSVMDISEGDLVYEVGAGLAYNGAKMDFGSSLDFGLFLVAHRGEYLTEDHMDNYTLELTGADQDVEHSITIYEEAEGVQQLLIMAKGIAAKEMRDDITFTVKLGEDVWFTKTMSVYDAACEFRAEELRSAQEQGREADGEYITMLADMVHYGTRAQESFSYDLRSLSEKPDLEETSSTVAGTWIASGWSEASEYAEKVTTSLSLKEQIELNFYVYESGVDVSDVVFQVNGDAIGTDGKYSIEEDTVHDGKVCTRVSFHDILVTQARDGIVSFVVTMEDGTNFTVSGSIADYVLRAKEEHIEVDLVNSLQKYVDSVCAVLGRTPANMAARVTVLEEQPELQEEQELQDTVEQTI